MKEYEFTLRFSLPDSSADPETFVEQLAEAGCDDAIIGIGKSGRITLNFTRESNSAWDAISSAIKDVRKVIPGIKLVEACPDFVGLSDIAEVHGFSRQNMRKIMVTSGAAFPEPVHEGNPAIWHLAKALTWLRDNKNYQVDNQLLEIATANMQLNIAKEVRGLDFDFNDEVLSLVA